MLKLASTEELVRRSELEQDKKIRLGIYHEGQRYVDEEVYRIVSRMTETASCVRACYGSSLPEKIETLGHYERTRLKWMKPGPDGKLIPR